jgi:hydrogenase maturation factor
MCLAIPGQIVETVDEGNDGRISFGQAAVARARLAGGESS